jgi:trehalose 6-phosphate synthase
MNLVAKEFVAARATTCKVLILSQFAGAARELHEALIVNPYYIDQMAESLHRALGMPENEQRERMRPAPTRSEFSIYRWAGRMLRCGSTAPARAYRRARIGETQESSSAERPTGIFR